MYLRTTQRKNKDGSIVRYVQLAHNRRDGHSTTAEVLVNFGREDALDLEGLRRLVGSINRYLGDDDASDVAAPLGEGFSVRSSRQFGTAYLLDALWHALGVDDALRGVLGSRRFTTDVERVLFALVANRAIDPSSKPRTWPSRGWTRWTRTRPIGRWTFSSPPTPRPRSKRRCSFRSPAS